MNTYSKFCSNVFVAKCEQQYQKGEHIFVQTKYGKENECIVFNLVHQQDGYYYYSIVRADGFNFQEHAKRRAEKLLSVSGNAEKKSDQYFKASDEGKDFLSLGEPIKIGHHSERRHRALIQRNWNRMGKAVEFLKKSEEYENKASYWEKRVNDINLSMPESIEYYEYRLEQATKQHEGIKSGAIPKEHSYSLTYAKKEVNEVLKALETAKKLWG